MQVESKTYSIKSGQSVLVRSANLKDALDLMNLKRSYIMNTTSIPLELHEYPVDLEKESQIISSYTTSSNSILLVAESEGKLIGNIDLTGSKRTKMLHTAMIGMGIREEWRNQGLGKIMMEAALRWAKACSELEIIWLNVYASNELGFNLYKKMGFNISGTIPGFFKSKMGYDDKVQMYLRIVN